MSFGLLEVSAERPVAFCGMGLLGSNFSLRLLERGLKVRVHNRTAKRCEPLKEAGAEVAASLADCARGVSRVHLTLRSDESVNEVLQELAKGKDPNERLFVVDHTTTSAKGAKARSEEWSAKGVDYIHAPVFMGPGNARKSSGYMLVGGDKAKFEAVRPDLEAMTGTVWYVGEDPSRAAALKLVGNQMLMAITATLADSMALAHAHGLERKDIVALLENFPVASSFDRRLERLCEADYKKPSWELQMARKDTALMQAQCEQAGRPLLLVDAIASAMDEQIKAGEAESDWTVCVRKQLGN